ncbi:MAG: hypothetical protein AABW73_01880 [Nanoarchaeota archaeon]
MGFFATLAGKVSNAVNSIKGSPNTNNRIRDKLDSNTVATNSKSYNRSPKPQDPRFYAKTIDYSSKIDYKTTNTFPYKELDNGQVEVRIKPSVNLNDHKPGYDLFNNRVDALESIVEKDEVEGIRRIERAYEEITSLSNMTNYDGVSSRIDHQVSRMQEARRRINKILSTGDIKDGMIVRYDSNSKKLIYFNVQVLSELADSLNNKINEFKCYEERTNKVKRFLLNKTRENYGERIELPNPDSQEIVGETPLSRVSSYFKLMSRINKKLLESGNASKMGKQETFLEDRARYLEIERNYPELAAKKLTFNFFTQES